MTILKRDVARLREDQDALERASEDGATIARGASRADTRRMAAEATEAAVIARERVKALADQCEAHEDPRM